MLQSGILLSLRQDMVELFLVYSQHRSQLVSPLLMKSVRWLHSLQMSLVIAGEVPLDHLAGSYVQGFMINRHLRFTLVPKATCSCASRSIVGIEVVGGPVVVENHDLLGVAAVYIA